MAKRSLKATMVVAMLGAVFQFGGCINGLLPDILLNAATELIWDSDAIFDFFGDDGPGLIL
jgi:hypothetical protein